MTTLTTRLMILDLINEAKQLKRKSLDVSFFEVKIHKDDVDYMLHSFDKDGVRLDIFGEDDLFYATDNDYLSFDELLDKIEKEEISDFEKEVIEKLFYLIFDE